VRQTEIAAQSLGIQLQLLSIRHEGEFERVFSEAQGAGGLIQIDDVLFSSHWRKLVELAAKHHLAAMYGVKEFVDDGGLMSYGPDGPDQYRRAATYFDRIFKGAKPADLPVEQPTKFELVINLKTAKALGLTFPPSVLRRADQSSNERSAEPCDIGSAASLYWGAELPAAHASAAEPDVQC